jgi:hypothetical protein
VPPDPPPQTMLPEPSHGVISFPAHPWALVACITNHSTLLLLVLLYVVFGTATSLPEKCWGPMRSPGKVAPHNHSPLHLLEAPSSLALGQSSAVRWRPSRARSSGGRCLGARLAAPPSSPCTRPLNPLFSSSHTRAFYLLFPGLFARCRRFPARRILVGS